MKNKILVILFAIYSSTAYSQIQKGAGYFGGELSGYTNNSENPDAFIADNSQTSNWTFEFSYGHYLTDNLAIGLGAGMNSNHYKYESIGDNYYSLNKQNSKLYYLSPFVRISKKIIDNFYCFGSLELQAGTGTQESSYNSTNSQDQSSERKLKNMGLGLTGGLNYFLNRHFALTLSYGDLSYNYITAEDKDTDEKTISDSFRVDLGLSSIGIGLQYFINNGADKK